MARQEGLVSVRSRSVKPSRATLIRVAFIFSRPSVLPNKFGTPGGTRTPDLLLRRIGQGVFSALNRPFGAVR